MDESNAGAKPDPKELEPRPPVEADLAALCRELNQRGARYVVYRRLCGHRGWPAPDDR